MSHISKVLLSKYNIINILRFRKYVDHLQGNLIILFKVDRFTFNSIRGVRKMEMPDNAFF